MASLLVEQSTAFVPQERIKFRKSNIVRRFMHSFNQFVTFAHQPRAHSPL